MKRGFQQQSDNDLLIGQIIECITFGEYRHFIEQYSDGVLMFFVRNGSIQKAIIKEQIQDEGAKIRNQGCLIRGGVVC